MEKLTPIKLFHEELQIEIYTFSDGIVPPREIPDNRQTFLSKIKNRLKGKN